MSRKLYGRENVCMRYVCLLLLCSLTAAGKIKCVTSLYIENIFIMHYRLRARVCARTRMCDGHTKLLLTLWLIEYILLPLFRPVRVQENDRLDLRQVMSAAYVELKASDVLHHETLWSVESLPIDRSVQRWDQNTVRWDGLPIFFPMIKECGRVVPFLHRPLYGLGTTISQEEW